MPDREAEKIAKYVVEKLEANRCIDKDTHGEHHDYLRLLMAKEERRLQVYDQIKLHLMKYGAVAVVSVAFFAAWQYFKAALQS